MIAAQRDDRTWVDVLALGEVMLRFDPGEGRIATARRFDVWEGGGEYNVVRGLRRCFGRRTAVLTALADDPLGHLVEDLVLTGGVDTSLLRWVSSDGRHGRPVRNALNFLERGFGLRGALGVSDRSGSATSQLRAGDVDWDAVFARGVRWFHTGGVFAGLSDDTAAVAAEALAAARRAGVRTSYDTNYRASLYAGRGGAVRAREVDESLVGHVDVLFGALALAGEPGTAPLRTEQVPAALEAVAATWPATAVVATTLRTVPSAGVNGWGAAASSPATGTVAATWREAVPVLDRVGSGDAFAAGVVHGLLDGAFPVGRAGLQRAVDLGAAHGALVMSTPGDTSMATAAEVEALAEGGSAAVQR